MKTLVTLTAAIALLTLGCSSTVTLGPKANDTKILGASAGEEGVSVTLPLVRGQITPTTSAPKKKKQ